MSAAAELYERHGGRSMFDRHPEPIVNIPSPPGFNPEDHMGPVTTTTFNKRRIEVGGRPEWIVVVGDEIVDRWVDA